MNSAVALPFLVSVIDSDQENADSDLLLTTAVVLASFCDDTTGYAVSIDVERGNFDLCKASPRGAGLTIRVELLRDLVSAARLRSPATWMVATRLVVFSGRKRNVPE